MTAKPWTPEDACCALLFSLNLKWPEGKGALGARAFVCLFSVSDPDSTQKAGCMSASCLSGASGSGNPGVCVLDRAHVVTQGEIKLLEIFSPVKQHLWLPVQRSKATFCTQL